MADRQQRATELYRQWGPAVYRRCLKLLHDPEAAKDASEEVFVKLVLELEKLEHRESALARTYRVATRHCLNLRRHAHRSGEAHATGDLELSSTGTSPASTYPLRALSQSLLSRFDVTTQSIAVGVLVDGMEHEELAEALGVSQSTVARKLERFLEKSRLHLRFES